MTNLRNRTIQKTKNGGLKEDFKGTFKGTTDSKITLAVGPKHEIKAYLKEIAEDQAPASPSRSNSLQFLSLPQMERFDWSCRIVRGLESLISHSGP